MKLIHTLGHDNDLMFHICDAKYSHFHFACPIFVRYKIQVTVAINHSLFFFFVFVLVLITLSLSIDTKKWAQRHSFIQWVPANPMLNAFRWTQMIGLWWNVEKYSTMFSLLKVLTNCYKIEWRDLAILSLMNVQDVTWYILCILFRSISSLTYLCILFGSSIYLLHSPA